MNYRNYFNRNKIIDNSYTCLHFSDKMKVQIMPENRQYENKVINQIHLSETIKVRVNHRKYYILYVTCFIIKYSKYLLTDSNSFDRFLGTSQIREERI